MNRREFISAGLVAGLAPVGALAAANQAVPGTQSLYELRKYHMHVGAKRNQLNNFLADAAIPAWNRIGVEPVGAFTPMYGPNQPTLYVLLPYPSLDVFVSATDRLLSDKTFRQAGREFLNAPLSDPGYVRMENWLLQAFAGMPKIELPPMSKKKSDRIFELRTYESHSVIAGEKKVEMFNDGEIAIFKKTGLQPVFFGKTLVGQRLPNLTYMVAFEDMNQRNQRWETFRNDPDWAEMSADPQYADTVSNISDYILRPTSYSQI